MATSPDGQQPESPHPPSLQGSMLVPLRVLAIGSGVLLLALVFGAWGLWRVAAPATDDIRTRLAAAERELEKVRAELTAEQQRATNLSRSDQISRDANRELQGALAARDEEIAGLRADVAFYERLVGSTEQRRGLSVHALQMKPQSERAWHFQATLTRNLDRDVVSEGQLTLSVEGSRGGRLQTLQWDELRQQPRAPGVAFSFRYFQQVQGDVFLPEGFEPVRVNVHLDTQSGADAEQSFTWAEAAPREAPAPEPAVE